MATGNWLDNLIPTFILLCKGERHSKFERTQVLQILKILGEREKGKPEHKRSGFWHVLNYAETGLSKFLNRVEKDWNQVQGPTMSSAIQTEPKDSAHKSECTLAIELDKDSYLPEDIHRILKDYLIQNVDPPFDCLVVQAAKVKGAWYDLHLRYSNNLVDTFRMVTQIPWCKDAVVKPLSDFGRFTLAQIK